MARLPTVIFIDDDPEPGAAILEGEKVIVTWDGSPDADKEMAELKLLETLVVTVETPEDPGATVNAVGAALMLKSEVAAAVTVRDTVAV